MTEPPPPGTPVVPGTAGRGRDEPGAGEAAAGGGGRRRRGGNDTNITIKLEGLSEVLINFEFPKESCVFLGCLRLVRGI